MIPPQCSRTITRRIQNAAVRWNVSNYSQDQLCRCFLSTRSRSSVAPSRSSAAGGGGSAAAPSSSAITPTSPSQPFVQTRLQAGEWDLQRTDPLYRPKWKSRAKIISEEDFANRPPVGLSSEFESFTDAMVTLSWFNASEQKQMYQLYLELLQHAHNKHKVTSHEYVVKVIAQKYNITPQRVAGIIQLQHNEEQYKNDPNRVLLNEAAEYMDHAIQQEIQDAYQTYNLKKPNEFVEDPLGVIGKQESKQWQVAEDLFDVDQILQDTVVREEREARLIIDSHVYVEDKDDEDIAVPLSKDAKQLLKAHQKFHGPDSVESTKTKSTASARDDAAVASSTGKDRRKRWQYVAQVVNTRELRKSKSKHRGYTNHSPENTLVEHDGTLRGATLAEVKQTAWKPTRNVLEHTFQRAKKGWLDRTVRGVESAWGRIPDRPTAVLEATAGTSSNASRLGNGSSSDEESDESSTSESETSDSSAEEESGAEDDIDDEKKDDPPKEEKKKK